MTLGFTIFTNLIIQKELTLVLDTSVMRDSGENISTQKLPSMKKNVKVNNYENKWVYRNVFIQLLLVTLPPFFLEIEHAHR